MILQKTLLIAFCIVAILSSRASDFKLISPDKNITIEVILKEKIYYTVSFKGDRVLEASPLTLTLENTNAWGKPQNYWI